MERVALCTLNVNFAINNQYQIRNQSYSIKNHSFTEEDQAVRLEAKGTYDQKPPVVNHAQKPDVQ